MGTVIYFTCELPGLSEELSEAHFQVYEALAVSEVLYLCEEHPEATVLIVHTVEPEAAKPVRQRQITLHLVRETTVRDVIWELSGLFPNTQIQ